MLIVICKKTINTCHSSFFAMKIAIFSHFWTKESNFKFEKQLYPLFLHIKLGLWSSKVGFCSNIFDSILFTLAIFWGLNFVIICIRNYGFYMRYSLLVLNWKLGGFMSNFVVKFPLDPIKSSFTREAGKFAKHQFCQFAKIFVWL